MRPIDVVLRRTIQITGVAQVVLGIAFWTGHALSLIPVHMWVGILFVLAIWILALRAGLAGAGRGLTVAGFVYGLFVIAFGMAQAQVLPGPNHWIIRVLHLAAGFGAMGLADGLWRRMRQANPASVVRTAAALESR
jgi:hypothetical protein